MSRRRNEGGHATFETAPGRRKVPSKFLGPILPSRLPARGDGRGGGDSGRGRWTGPLCYNRAVKVRVRLFASYREAAGSPLVEVPLEEGAGGPALWAALVARYPALARLPAPAGYAVNDEYVQEARPLRESDEVALIPPVSGGDGTPRPGAAHGGAARADGAGTQGQDPRDTTGAAAARESRADARVEGPQDGAGRRPAIEITDRPISVDRLLDAAADPRAGAIVLFLGVVRDHARGRRVRHLEYEAYEALARREMERIAAAVRERWPVARIAIAHRTGRLQVGEASVAIAVSAPHRPEAFEAARFAIDTLKQTVPIWKKEVWEGGEAWVGAEA